jgi:hypothetical protein
MLKEEACRPPDHLFHPGDDALELFRSSLHKFSVAPHVFCVEFLKGHVHKGEGGVHGPLGADGWRRDGDVHALKHSVHQSSELGYPMFEQFLLQGRDIERDLLEKAMRLRRQKLLDVGEQFVNVLESAQETLLVVLVEFHYLSIPPESRGAEYVRNKR